MNCFFIRNRNFATIGEIIIWQRKTNLPVWQHSALTVETTVTGNISASTDIRIDGILQGNLDCQGKVIYGEQGQCTGRHKACQCRDYGNCMWQYSCSRYFGFKVKFFSGRKYYGYDLSNRA